MPGPSPAYVKLRDTLQKTRPDTISSADSLAAQFGIDRKSVANLLSQLGYVKNKTTPTWYSPLANKRGEYNVSLDKATLSRLQVKAEEGLSEDYLLEDGEYDLYKVHRDCSYLLAIIFQESKRAHLTLTMQGFKDSKGKSITPPRQQPIETVPEAYDVDPRELDGGLDS